MGLFYVIGRRPGLRVARAPPRSDTGLRFASVPLAAAFHVITFNGTKLKLCRPPARRGVSKHGVPTVPLPSPSERGSLTSPAWGRGQERAGAARGPAGLGVARRLRNQLSKVPHGSGSRGRSLGDGGRGGTCLRFRPILLAPPLSALRLRLGRALQRPGSGGGGGWSWAWRREGRGGASGTAGPRLGRLRLGLALHSVAAGAFGSVSPPGSAR